MKTKRKSKDFLDCVYCDKVFRYESERKRHEQSHCPQFECKVCKKKFSFISALRRHEKQHERTGSVQCDQCKKRFRDEILLKRHIKYAHEGNYDCSKCNATFSSETALRTHMKIHNPESERKYRCRMPGCSKSFNFAQHLKNHEFTHTNVKQFHCEICGKGFIQSHQMKLHALSHDPSAWLQCPVPDCTKKFTNGIAIKRHLRVHKKEVDEWNSYNSKTDNTDGQKVLDVLPNTVGENESLKELTVEDLKLILKIPNVTGVIVNLSTKHKGVNAKTKEESSSNLIDNSAIANCKLELGGCIVSGDTKIDSNFLCPQMASSVDECYDQLPNEGTSKSHDDIGTVKNVTIANKEPSLCEGCECGNANNLQATRSCGEFNQDKVINDVAIKIEAMGDTEIVKDENAFVPFNSCKSVLGKCIVSGNGTMGEGCLCAKMAFDDQSLIAEEIDEITPRPKND